MKPTEWPTGTPADGSSGIYDFRIKAFNHLGVPSVYSTTLNRQISGLSAAPSQLNNLTISSIGGMAYLNWDVITELDVTVGGHIEFRHTLATTGVTWASSVAIGDLVPGQQVSTLLPLKPGTYLAKVIDSSGIKSTVVTVLASAAQAINFANLAIINENPGFTGIKTNLILLGGKLKLDNTGKFDDIADLDLLLSNIDAASGIASTGTYDFAAGIDLTTVKRTRLRTVIDATVVNQLTLFDDRDDLIDTWDDFDATDIAKATIQVWVRETNDDPAASPVWSAWQRLESAEYEARGFDFQARFFSFDPTFNIEVSQITVESDGVV